MKTSQSIPTITHVDIINRTNVVFGGSIGLDTANNSDFLEESWVNYDNVYVNHVSDINNALWLNKVLKEDLPTIMLCKFDARTNWFTKACKIARLGIVIKAYMTDDNQCLYNHHVAVFLFNTNRHSTTFIEVFSDLGYFLY